MIATHHATLVVAMTKMNMIKSIIVAKADNNAIGINGDLPWHISEDLKFFKQTTIGSPIIMGRTTFDSLGHALPGRLNIVLSRGELSLPQGVIQAKSLEEAYKIAEKDCFIIGGATVYKEAIADVDILYVTEVHTIIEDADAFFPEIDLNIWKEVSRSETFTDHKYSFEFVKYLKR